MSSCDSRFDKIRFLYDLGLIVVSKAIIFGGRVQPAEYSWREIPDKVALTLTGWGRTTKGSENERAPKMLQTIDLNYVNFEECKQLYPHPQYIDFSHVCTFNKIGEGACFGDS